MSDKSIPKVLLSAYACEPTKGSEPGVGWCWQKGLSDKVTLTVLTRENSRALIEEAIAQEGEGSQLKNTRFIYHDLSNGFLWLKAKGFLPAFIYYVIWQISAARKFHQLAEEHDVVHHLTFCSLLCPGFWKVSKAKFMIGPVGAPLVDSRYLKLFGSKAPVQYLRSLVMRRFMALPWLNSLFHRASVIVPANTSTRDLLIEQGLKPKPVMLDTGSPVHDEMTDLSRPTKTSEDGCRFVYAGRLEARKGLLLSIRAFGLACQNREFCGRFAIIGDGPQKKYLFDLVQSLGLRERVFFLGQRSLAEVYFEFRASDVFLFSSVRDTSGGVNLEAMSLGLPVVCINHQGVEDITTDRCALRVNPDTIQRTIENLAEMIVKMDSDPDLRNRLSIEAIGRAKEDFRWEDKFVKMVSYYQESLSR